MERTELRVAFFDEIRRDPYTAAIETLMTQMWAEGYEKARRDVENHLGPDAADCLRTKSYAELRHDAAEWLTDTRQEATAKLAVALAAIGPLLPGDLGKLR